MANSKLRMAAFLMSFVISCGFNIDVHTLTQNLSQPIFDISHGLDGRAYKTTYSIDELRSEFPSYFKIGRSTGQLYIEKLPSCPSLYFSSFHNRDNSVNLYIKTVSVRKSRDSGSTFINSLNIVTVNFSGPRCWERVRRKRDTGINHLSVIYERKKLCQHGSHANTIKMNFNHVLPYQTSRCLTQVTVQNHPHLRYDVAKSLLVYRCPLMATKNTLFGQVRVSCDNGDFEPTNYALKIQIRPKNNQESDVSEVYSRSKRGANTQPFFASPSYVKNVDEEQAAGVLVGMVTATDSDSGDAGTLVYSLEAASDGRSQTMFKINQNSGKITTTKILDRETMRQHIFRVIAKDRGRPVQSAVAMLTVNVDDINDHAPKFEHGGVYSRDVSENANDRFNILSVRATDRDSGSNKVIRYSLVNSRAPNDIFNINAKSGRITLRGKLDREKIAHYRLEIVAVDQGTLSKRQSASAVVDITVIDENDNYPQFAKSRYTASVREDIDVSKHPVIATISATDKDGSYNLVSYRITNPEGIFAIDSKLGKVTVIQSLDFETTQKYFLNIRALDNGNPPKSNTTVLDVNVIDVNDNDPVYQMPLYEESVKENVGDDFEVISVLAFDLDSGKNGQIRYSLKNTPAGIPLKIGKESGAISTKGELDREKATSYSFEVVATDSGVPPRSASTSVLVKVVDVNDNPPVFKPKVYRESVSEVARPGKRVTSVTATDKDVKENARITYSIKGGNTKSAFRIRTQSSEGIITVAKALDYKVIHYYMLIVTATDSGGLVDTAIVHVNVTAINKYAPKFQEKPYRKSVFENVPVGTVVEKVRALDNDIGENARITYSIDGDGVQVFMIDPHSGEIKTRLSLDREKTAGFVLSVSATDHGKPPRMDTTDVEITVKDVNDNAPEFVEVSYGGTVSEDADVGTSVLQLDAKDRDAGPNGDFYFAFRNGAIDDSGSFEVDEMLGEIRTAKKLDRETVPRYDLVVFVIDRGEPPIGPKSMSVTVKIKVDDVNDNAPRFASDVIDVYVKENSPVGSVVGRITADDPDEGMNAQVEYSIVGGPDFDSFQLVSRPGDPAIIKTKIELDYESRQHANTYELNIRAMSGSRLKDAKVRIHVQDVNDNKPIMANFAIVLNNFPANFPSGIIGRVPAHDPDVNDVLRYSFVSPSAANLLHLNESTGEISLPWLLLNSDVTRNGTFHIKVTGELCPVNLVHDTPLKIVGLQSIFYDAG